MGFEGEMTFNGTTDDPALAMATTYTLENLLIGFGEGVEHDITIYRDDKEITKLELTDDYKKHCGL